MRSALAFISTILRKRHHIEPLRAPRPRLAPTPHDTPPQALLKTKARVAGREKQLQQKSDSIEATVAEATHLTTQLTHTLNGVASRQNEGLDQQRVKYADRVRLCRELGAQIGASADMLGAAGQYEAAEGVLLSNVRMKEGAFGGNHPEVASTFQQLAHLCEAQGDWYVGSKRHTLAYLDETGHVPAGYQLYQPPANRLLVPVPMPG